MLLRNTLCLQIKTGVEKQIELLIFINRKSFATFLVIIPCYLGIDSDEKFITVNAGNQRLKIT